MKVIIGFLLGLGTAWAALAIWQRLPEFPDIDDDTPVGHVDHVYETWAGINITGSLSEERPEVLQRLKYPPIPPFNPYVHLPRRPYQP